MKNLEKLSPEHKNYQSVAQAIRFLVENRMEQPSLKAVSAELNMSEYHLQRQFTQWAGLSPKQFLQYLTKEHAKRQLRLSSVMEAAWGSGLSGSSRLHDLLITHESITPGEYKKHGAGLCISYGIHSSPFGYCFIAVTERGLCKLAFFDQPDEQDVLLAELASEWNKATIKSDETATYESFAKIFPEDNSGISNIHLVLKGTPFRLLVWEALLKIPDGSLISYQQVANSINKPSAVRAVASAIANNQIGYLIPCHRVIRESGALGGYRWGLERKMAIIGHEKSKQ